MKLKTNKTKLSLALTAILLLPLGLSAYAEQPEMNYFVYDGFNIDITETNPRNTIYPQKDGQIITQDNTTVVNFNPDSPGVVQPQQVFGGYYVGNQSSDVTNTHVLFKNGTNGNNMVGAMVQIRGAIQSPININASGTVTVEDGVIKGSINGAAVRSAFGTNPNSFDSTISAEGELIINGGTVSTISGALVAVGSEYNDTQVKGKIIFNGGTVTGFMYGAYTGNNINHAEGLIEVNGGEFRRSVRGVNAASGSESYIKGTIVVNGGTFKENVDGALSESLVKYISNSEGIVFVNDGVLESGVRGAIALTAKTVDVTDNTSQAKGIIDISGGKIDNKIIGSWAWAKGKVIGESDINFQGGTFTGATFYSNQVTMPTADEQATDDIRRDVFLRNSSITLGQDANITNPDLVMLGGYVDGRVRSKDLFTNNRLEFHGKPLTLSTLGNFSNYNLYLNDANSQLVNTDSALITVTKNLHSEDTWTIDEATGDRVVTVNKPTILLKGISGEKRVVGGEYVHLLSLTDGAKITTGDYAITDGELTEVANLSDFFELGETHELQVGLASKVEVEYEIDDENQYVTARFVTPKEIDEELVEANVQPMVADRLAALMNITRKHGLQDPAMRDLVHGKVTPFVLMQGGRDRYQLDSHITADTFDALIGAGYKQNALSIAGYISYGYDDYKSYNNTSLGQVKGKGHNSSYGIGFSGIYEFNEALYADFGAQVGRIKTTYSSNDILTGGGTFANYNSKSTYFSGYVGGGYVHSLNKTSRLDTSLRYMYSHIGSDTVTIDGDTIDFGGLTSSIAEIKTRYEVDVTDESTFNASLGYQYEFDAKGDARIAGIAVNAPGLKGSTGVVGIGYEYQPYSENEDSFLNRSKINIDAQGYFGKRRGGNIAITYRYMFD